MGTIKLLLALTPLVAFAGDVSLEKARELACDEIARIGFVTESQVCKEDLRELEGGDTAYAFTAHDVSGDCDVLVLVSKTTGEVQSGKECN